MAYFVTPLLVTLLLKLTLDFKLSRGNSSVTSSSINSFHFERHHDHCIIIGVRSKIGPDIVNDGVNDNEGVELRVKSLFNLEDASLIHCEPIM